MQPVFNNISEPSKRRLKIIISLVFAFFISHLLTLSLFPFQSPTPHYSNALAFFKLQKIKVTRFLQHELTKLNLYQVKPPPTLTPNVAYLPLTQPTIAPQLHAISVISPIVGNPTTQPLPSDYQNSTATPTIILTINYFPTSFPTATPKQLTQTLSNSKVSIFVIDRVTTGVQQIIDSCPRVIKILDPQLGDKKNLIQRYKTLCPDGKVIARFYHPQGSLPWYDNGGINNPENYAQIYYDRIEKIAIQSLGQYKMYIDYLTGPNEFEDLPYPWDLPSSQVSGDETTTDRVIYQGRFWRKLAEIHYSQANLKTCILNAPYNTISENTIILLLPYFRELKSRYQIALCIHDYGQNTIGDFSYRRFYNVFKRSAPELLSLPLLIGEAGYVENVVGSKSKEQLKIDIQNYDRQISGEVYVLGATLFQIGSSDSRWAPYDLEPIAGWLSNYLKN